MEIYSRPDNGLRDMLLARLTRLYVMQRDEYSKLSEEKQNLLRMGINITRSELNEIGARDESNAAWRAVFRDCPDIRG